MDEKIYKTMGSAGSFHTGSWYLCPCRWNHRRDSSDRKWSQTVKE